MNAGGQNSMFDSELVIKDYILEVRGPLSFDPDTVGVLVLARVTQNTTGSADGAVTASGYVRLKTGVPSKAHLSADDWEHVATVNRHDPYWRFFVPMLNGTALVRGRPAFATAIKLEVKDDGS